LGSLPTPLQWLLFDAGPQRTHEDSDKNYLWAMKLAQLVPLPFVFCLHSQLQAGAPQVVPLLLGQLYGEDLKKSMDLEKLAEPLGIITGISRTINTKSTNQPSVSHWIYCC
jgi:hypothetical protein